MKSGREVTFIADKCRSEELRGVAFSIRLISGVQYSDGYCILNVS